MFVGSILAVILGVATTLYIQAYYVPEHLKDKGIYEVSQLVWGIFLVLNVSLTYASRELVRETLERRWKAGIGLKRVLVAGAGELGRMVVDKILEHRELGYKVVGFVDDRAGGDHLGYRGLPLLGTLNEAGEIIQRERIDQLYVALPLEEHVKMVSLVESANREFVDIKVVPDLCRSSRCARGSKISTASRSSTSTTCRSRASTAVLKRAIDVGLSAAALLVLSLPLMLLLALLIKTTSKGPAFYRQERMGLDGKRVLRLEVPLDVRRSRARTGTGLGARRRPALHAGRQAPAPLRASTSCRSSGTCSRATCRWSARGPSGRSSSSSSSSAFRSTCCATR